MASKIVPHYYQDEARHATVHFDYEGGERHPLIALPTGTGKSVVIGSTLNYIMQHAPSSRFAVATHVKELIEQNHDRLLEIWPHAPTGVYSAGLKARETSQPIIFGGVKSMVKVTKELRYRDALLIDEAHLVSPAAESMYQELIHGLQKFNRELRVIGYTATAFRQRLGALTDGGLFTDIAYNKTDIPGFAELLRGGYIAPLHSKKTVTQLDVTGVSMNYGSGDFNLTQLQDAVNDDKITLAALREAIAWGYNRQSWLCFAAGVEHAETIASMLNGFGFPTATIHSKISSGERRDRLKAFRTGKLRCLVGNNVLTTGFDHKPIDLIIMLRPTRSSSLWVQMLGRGTRPFAGDELFAPKTNCLTLDFAGNTAELGPINDPVMPRKPGEKKSGDAPIKICESCGTYNHTSARFCEDCGAPFNMQPKITKQASNLEVMILDGVAHNTKPDDLIPVIETFGVNSVQYAATVSKKTGANMLQVIYITSTFKTFREFIHFEGPNPAMAKRALEWWYERSALEPPDTVAEALTVTKELRVPARIKVHTNSKPYPNITRCEYDL